MKVYIESDCKTVELDHSEILVKDLLSELGINPSTVIVAQDGIKKLDDVVSGDVRILSVVTGG